MRIKRAARPALPVPPAIGAGRSMRMASTPAQVAPTEGCLIRAHKQMSGAEVPPGIARPA